MRCFAQAAKLRLEKVHRILPKPEMYKFCSNVSGKIAIALPLGLFTYRTCGLSEVPMGTRGMSYAQINLPELRRNPACYPAMTPKVDIQNLVTVQQAAKILNITAAAIHKAIKRGRLPCLKLGRLFLIQRADLIHYSKTKSVGGRPKKQIKIG